MDMKRAATLGLLALALAWAGRARAAVGVVDGTLTVTPVATVSLALAPTYYAFGDVDLAGSTHSMTMQGLHNLGTVSVAMQKKVQTEPAGWTAGASAGANVYVLYAATSAAATPPDTAVFTGNAATKFLAASASNGLDEGSGDDGTLPLTGNTTIWYRLDMPTASGTQDARTITVRYTGTAL